MRGDEIEVGANKYVILGKKRVKMRERGVDMQLNAGVDSL